MSELFEIVGVKPELAEQQVQKKANRWYDTIPWLSVIILILIVGGCLFCNRIMTKDPSYMDLKNYTIAPCKEFLFGTDTMGRDIFSMIWYGGRQSLFIGIAATVIFLQAILGKANVFSLSFVIGITSWMSIAKIIRTEVRQLRNNEYVIAARCMGGGFFYILYKHLAPNFLSSIMFMVVMNIRSAIVEESTLSFIGIGLPLEVISWGSMLSLSEKALLTGAWWIILLPGVFLVVTLLCITSIGDCIRKKLNKQESNL